MFLTIFTFLSRQIKVEKNILWEVLVDSAEMNKDGFKDRRSQRLVTFYFRFKSIKSFMDFELLTSLLFQTASHLTSLGRQHYPSVPFDARLKH